jgi:hypothetical protein
MAADAKRSPLFEISTEAAEPVPFAVDGELYHIHGFEFMSKAEEARTTALFSRYDRLSRRLEEAKSREDAERIAGAMYDLRMELLTTLTDLPREVAEKLPMSGQTKLMREISRETGQDAEPEDGEEPEPDY